MHTNTPSTITPEKFGYRVDRRDEFERIAPRCLVDRAAQFPGDFVLWDPEDDCDGVMLVGATSDEVRRDFAALGIV